MERAAPLDAKADTATTDGLLLDAVARFFDGQSDFWSTREREDVVDLAKDRHFRQLLTVALALPVFLVHQQTVIQAGTGRASGTLICQHG